MHCNVHHNPLHNYVYVWIVTRLDNGVTSGNYSGGGCHYPVKNVDVVSMHLNFGIPLGLAPSTSMSSTVLVVWSYI